MMFGLMPFENSNFDDLFTAIDRMEQNFYRGLDGALPQFRADIQDQGDHYLMEAELPGFCKEDISIDVKGNYLTVSAQHKEEKETKERNYLRKERRYGSYSRSFDITGINPSSIKAGYKDGVLSLELPKERKEPRGDHQVTIE